MFVLLKLLELLVEEGVDCAIEASLIADECNSVDDEVAIRQPRIVVVGAVQVDEDELEYTIAEVPVNVNKPH